MSADEYDHPLPGPGEHDRSGHAQAPLRVADILTLPSVSERVERLAAGLDDRGVRPGRPVNLLMVGRAEFLEAALALDRLGAVSMAIDHRLPPEAVASELARVGAEHLLVDAPMLVVGARARSALNFTSRMIVIAEPTSSGVAPRVVSGAGSTQPPVDYLSISPRDVADIFQVLRAGGHDGPGADPGALAAATPDAVAESARRTDQKRRQQQALQVAAGISRRMLSAEPGDPLRVIARWVQHIADADAVNIVEPTAEGDELHVTTATGVGAEQLDGQHYPSANTLTELVLRTGQPQLVEDIDALVDRGTYLATVLPVGPVMMLPLVSPRGVIGAFVVARMRGREIFTAVDLEMATRFADHAAVAMELSEARATSEQVVALEHRDRTARGLHDLIIQRLFGAGLTVESIAAGMSADGNAARLGQVVADIDATIREIRNTTF